MPDVRLICICNQFDADALIYRMDFENDISTTICSFEFGLMSEMIHKTTEQFDTNDIWLVGDNLEYLKGVREQVLSDHELNYSSNELNLHIIGE